ncbi:MAG TPA: sigma-70 family RNA polymerase sigma factor [Phycisphaerales bacterium]|nr:sigma-70 family RNA polymerase sigma factor [Phycisphaerales bacterium]HRQ74532.1 sigma-70 family RNA polymerase sigma factor [Phycisphaerales bacterium]
MPEPDVNVTQVLAQAQRGDSHAVHQLYSLVYAELHSIAGRFFASRQAGHTLQPTLIADDIFMKLVQNTDTSWEGRAHFFAVAAKAMRDLLVDHARTKRAQKRGGGWGRVTLDGLGVDNRQEQVDLMDLEAALSKLGTIDSRQERIVELRFFAGLTMEEIAQVLGVSERTVHYDWRMARAWLRVQLEAEGT